MLSCIPAGISICCATLYYSLYINKPTNISLKLLKKCPLSCKL